MNQSFAYKTQIRPILSAAPHRKVFVRYALSVMITATTILLHVLVGPYINREAFDLFQAAVLVSACLGGLGPAIFTSVLSIISLDYFFMAPLNGWSFAASDILRLAMFAAVSIFISSLSVRLKKTHKKLKRAYDDLEVRVQERTRELSVANEHLRQEGARRLEAEKTLLEISGREQRRLGQDLHDGLCQLLVGSKLIAEELKEKLSLESSPQAEDAGLIETQLSEALSQADALSRGLYPAELERNGLMSALNEMTEKISKRHQLNCRFKCEEVVPVHDSAVATHVYRVAQEAVANAIKRGKAKNIRVRLARRGTEGVLAVLDDGMGFKKEPLRRGMGLQIMGYRAHVINGRLKILSRSKGRTLVACAFPV